MRHTTRLRLRLAPLILAGPLWLAPASGVAQSTECCDPASPFREGEELPEKPATCQDVAQWAEKAPKTNARISFSIKGKLSKVESTSALAYLTMCGGSALQVVCITYETNEMTVGEEVSFAGGYERGTDGRIVLDPCLASRE